MTRESFDTNINRRGMLTHLGAVSLASPTEMNPPHTMEHNHE